jgi:hypothetical protein
MQLSDAGACKRPPLPWTHLPVKHPNLLGLLQIGEVQGGGKGGSCLKFESKWQI